MIIKLFNHPHIVSQTADDEHSLPEPTIAVHADNAGLMILSQGSNEILINRESVNEICKTLKIVRHLTESGK